nr:MAG TPA: hypothetical protein [Bacteriophage sp.]
MVKNSLVKTLSQDSHSLDCSLHRTKSLQKFCSATKYLLFSKITKMVV